ncbi:MAG TPA: hypothetical protein VGA56_12540 [Opitutaceae bacterium]
MIATGRTAAFAIAPDIAASTSPSPSPFDVLTLAFGIPTGLMLALGAGTRTLSVSRTAIAATTTLSGGRFLGFLGRGFASFLGRGEDGLHPAKKPGLTRLGGTGAFFLAFGVGRGRLAARGVARWTELLHRARVRFRCCILETEASGTILAGRRGLRLAFGRINRSVRFDRTGVGAGLRTHRGSASPEVSFAAAIPFPAGTALASFSAATALATVATISAATAITSFPAIVAWTGIATLIGSIFGQSTHGRADWQVVLEFQVNRFFHGEPLDRDGGGGWLCGGTRL